MLRNAEEAVAIGEPGIVSCGGDFHRGSSQQRRFYRWMSSAVSESGEKTAAFCGVWERQQHRQPYLNMTDCLEGP